MTTQFQSEDFDRSAALSQTAWALQELQLYGTRAFQASRHEGGESVRLLRTYPELRLV